MHAVTGFIYPDESVWDLAEKLRSALTTRYDELCRADAQWIAENSRHEGVTLASAASSLMDLSSGQHREPRVWIAPYDDHLYVVDMTGHYAEAIAAIDGMIDVSFGPEDPDATEAERELRERNVGVAEEAFPTGDVTAHGLHITVPADAGLMKIIRAGR